jgi:hypothetical protein
MEQEATRAIRTVQYAYWKRLKGTGENELYDIENDAEQARNLYGDPDYADVVEQLDGQLSEFFDTYSSAEYDLWRGGTVKGSTERAHAFKSLYGDGWEPESKIKAPFREEGSVAR